MIGSVNSLSGTVYNVCTSYQMVFHFYRYLWYSLATELWQVLSCLSQTWTPAVGTTTLESSLTPVLHRHGPS